MSRIALAVVVVLSLGSFCSKGAPVRAPDDPAVTAARVEVARAEARRGEGVAELTRLAGHADASVRAAALRGLGRVGDAAALEVLRTRVRDPQAGADALEAAAALGIAGALESVEAADAAAITAELIALHGRSAGGGQATVIEALGRVGTADALPVIAEALGSTDREIVVAAGVAIGRLARRQIAPDAAAMKAAIARAGDVHHEIRYAATYAMSRGYVAPAEGSVAPEADAVAAALAARIGDESSEVRALALAGLARRKARAAAGDAAVSALHDGDWRVAVEAVRLLVGEPARPDDLRAVAAVTVREWARLVNGEAAPGVAHVILEALRGLIGHGSDEKVHDAVATLARSVRDQPPEQRAAGQQLVARHVSALAHATLARLGGDHEITGDDALARIDASGLPDEVTGALVAEVLVGRNDDAAHRALLERSDGRQKPAHRAAALGSLPDVWASPRARDAIVTAIVDALPEERADVAGSAADAAAKILALLRGSETGEAWFAALEAALVARIASATDPELISSLLGAAGTARLESAKEACTKAHGDANPSIRAAARGCLKELTGADPGPGAAAPAPPLPADIDPAAVVGRSVRWTVETTRGTLVIDLDGDLAPWHVATIVALTGKGFYDGLLFHRVVPDFVVQGGDPTGTGWGGPGFTLPSEPSLAAYERGTIGVADAGKDTAGSQWFAMHAPAPHLAARYTVLGVVHDGVDHLDALLVGDRIVSARAEISDR